MRHVVIDELVRSMILSSDNDRDHDYNMSGDYPELNYNAGAKWIKSLTQGRLGNFNGGHFSDVNLGASRDRCSAPVAILTAMTASQPLACSLIGLIAKTLLALACPSLLHISDCH